MGLSGGFEGDLDVRKRGYGGRGERTHTQMTARTEGCKDGRERKRGNKGLEYRRMSVMVINILSWRRHLTDRAELKTHLFYTRRGLSTNVFGRECVYRWQVKSKSALA